MQVHFFMPTDRGFFSAEMARELRILRKKARLSQGEVARRMGRTGVHAKSYISRLERGTIKRPYLDTIVSYLHVCGARMSDFAMLLDRVEYLPEPRIPESSATMRERVGHLEPKVRREMADYQKKMQYPARTLPAAPERQRRGAEKLREYRIQVSVVEEALKHYLGSADVPIMYFANYYNVGRQILGILRRYKEPKQGRKLAEVLARAETKGLETRVLTEVRRITIEQLREKVVPAPTSETPADLPSKAELEQELSRLRDKIYADMAEEIRTNPEAVKFQRYGNYQHLANEILRKWFRLRCAGLASGPQLRSILEPVFDKIEHGDYVKDLIPELVHQVRVIVERNLPG